MRYEKKNSIVAARQHEVWEQRNRTLLIKTKLPAKRAGSFAVVSIAEEVLARLLTSAHTLVYCALGHKLRRPRLIAGTVRNQFSEYSDQQRRLPGRHERLGNAHWKALHNANLPSVAVPSKQRLMLTQLELPESQ